MEMFLPLIFQMPLNKRNNECSHTQFTDAPFLKNIYYYKEVLFFHLDQVRISFSLV